MREFHVTFDIDNDAFSEYPEGEIARILREVADKIENHGRPLVSYGVRDINGNVIGRVGMTISGDHRND